jgi:hypothetical protein
MSITRGLRWLVVLALLASVAPSASYGAGTNPPADPRERPSTVVVSVRDGGFHWTDAGVGAVAALATTLLALGIVLALRPDPRGTGNHEALS